MFRAKNDAKMTKEDKMEKLTYEMDELFKTSPRQTDVVEKFNELRSLLALDMGDLDVEGGKLISYTPVFGMAYDEEPDMMLAFTFLSSDNRVQVVAPPASSETVYYYDRSVDHVTGNREGHNIWVYRFDGESDGDEIMYVLVSAEMLPFLGRK